MTIGERLASDTGGLFERAERRGRRAGPSR